MFGVVFFFFARGVVFASSKRKQWAEIKWHDRVTSAQRITRAALARRSGTTVVLT